MAELSADGLPGQVQTKRAINSNIVDWIWPSELPDFAALEERVADIEEGGGGGSSEVITSYSNLPNITVPVDRDWIWTTGFADGSSKGMALCRRMAVEPSEAGSYTRDASGAYFQIDPYQWQINIAMFGASPSASGATNYAAIVACLIFCEAYDRETHFPSGDHETNAPIFYRQVSRIIGNGRDSKIWGNFADYIFYRDVSESVPNCNVLFRGLTIENRHASGKGLHIARGKGFRVEQCGIFADLVGAYVSYQAFSASFDTCLVVSYSGDQPAGSVGIVTRHHTTIITCDVTHWEQGVRAYGDGAAIIGNRIEVNKTGIMLGRDIDNQPFVLRGGQISGNSLEANDITISARSCEGVTISGNKIYGTSNAPAGASQTGILLQDCDGVTVTGNAVIGDFTTAGITANQILDGCVVHGNSVRNDSGTDVDWGTYVHTNCHLQTNIGQLNNYGSAQSICTGGKHPQSGTDGNDTQPSVTETYIAVISVPNPTIVTGIAILLGSAVGGNCTLALLDRIAVPISAAKTTSTTLVGAPTNALKRISFPSPVLLQPGEYYVAAQFDSTLARFRTHSFGNFGTEKVTSTTYGTIPTGTDGVTFTDGVGPMAYLF